MSARSPHAGDVFRFDRLGQFENVSWVAIGRHSRNASLVLLAPCVREAQSDAGRVVYGSDGDSWTLYPEVQLCVHEADLDDGDAIPSLKLHLNNIDSKKGPGVAGDFGIRHRIALSSFCVSAPFLGFDVRDSGVLEAEVEQGGRLDRLVQTRDAIEHRLHFGSEPDSSKPALNDCSVTSIDPEHREVKFHWGLDPNREYMAHATASGAVEIQQTYRTVDAASRDLQLALCVGTEQVDFDDGGRSAISSGLARIIEQQFGLNGLLVPETAPDPKVDDNAGRLPWLASLFGRPWFAPAALAAFAAVVVSMSNYWTSPSVDTAEYVVVSVSVSVSVPGAIAGAAAGLRGGDKIGGDILKIRLESKAIDKTAEHLTDKMTSLNALVTRRAISATNVNLMVALPPNSEDAAKVLELFGQEQRPPSALLLLEIARDSVSDKR